MTIQMFLRQLFRGKNRAFAVVILLCAVTGFFAMSVNLYQSSTGNLALVEDAFSTIAVVEFRQDMLVEREPGSLAGEKYVENRAVPAPGFPASLLTQAEGVEDYDFRIRCGGWLPGQLARTNRGDLMHGYDVIRFCLLSDQPVTLFGQTDGTAQPQTVELQVLESAAGFTYPQTFLASGSWLTPLVEEQYADQLQRLNRGSFTDRIILYPDTEYLLSLENTNVKLDKNTGIYTVNQPKFAPIFDRNANFEYQTYYFEDGTDYRSPALPFGEEQSFWLQLGEDVENDPVLQEHFQRASEIAQYDNSSFHVMLTKDVNYIFSFRSGETYLAKGRFITEEEYAAGKPVCMVSRRLADMQGWKVGDILDLHLYSADTLCYNVDHSINIRDMQPFWNPDISAFFAQGLYEIVGIYDQTKRGGSSEMDESTLALSWTAIVCPIQSIPGNSEGPEPLVHGSLLTLRLRNNQSGAFLDDMIRKNITNNAKEDLQVVLMIDDQGYSAIQPGLEAMQGTSKLLLGLSAALLVATVILLAYFFAQSQKHSVGIFRMLGGRKASAFAAVLACALLLTLFGATAGGLIGHGLSGIVGNRILTENLAQSREAAEFSAYLLAGGEPEIQLSAAADISTTLFSVGAGAALFLLLTAIFTLSYLPKEPRALLPEKQ